VSSVTSFNIHNTTVRVNGVNAAMSTTGANVQLDVPIGNNSGTAVGGIGGARVPFYDFTFKGDIAEVIVYGSALSDPDRASVESYLNSKYQVY
jgi:hypothetical protein